MEITQNMHSEKFNTTKKKVLKVLHQNIDGLKNKIDRLNHLLQLKVPDILVLTEHGLSENNMLNTILQGYSLVSAFSRPAHRKGGVAIYKRECLESVENIKVEDSSIPLVCEISGASVKMQGKETIYILGVYRPPYSCPERMTQALQLLSETLNSIPSSENNKILLVGDINIDLLKPSQSRILFEDLLSSHNLKRQQLPATRITQKSESSIDAVCTNLSETNIKVGVLHTGLSDHTGQICCLTLPVTHVISTNIVRRNFNSDNLSYLKSELADVSWNSVLSLLDVDNAYNSFVRILTMHMDSTCPLKKTRMKQNRKVSRICDAEAQRLRGEFLAADNRYLASNREEDKKISIQCKKAYDLKLKTLRREHSASVINNAENKSKAIWKVINGERKRSDEHQKSSIQLLVNGQKVENPTEVANYFNEYFTSIAEETLKQNGISNAKAEIVEQLINDSSMHHFSPVTAEEVLSAIDSLKLKPSTGIDGIPAKILKVCKQELYLPLLHVVKLSLEQGNFPQRLKISKVIPLHKKDSKLEISNYRPISLIPVISKIIEKIVLKRIMTHLHSKNLLTDQQHGFIKGRSTLTALVEMVESILNDIDRNNNVTGVFVDMSKAFDCLSHDLIIKKLHSLGFCGTTLEWFRSYLQGRHQVVELRTYDKGNMLTARSGILPMTRGVPQGSVLGPVLYVLFTNDLPTITNPFSKAIMYADDVALMTSRSRTEQLEIDSFIGLNIVQQYCNEQDLVFNTTKTKQIDFGCGKDNVSTLPDLEHVSSVKHLGIVIDNNLTWSDHVDMLCGKLSTAIFVLKRTKDISTAEATLTAYHALFQSHLNYGVAIWGGSSAQNLQRVLILQKRALRTMAGIKRQDSCRQLFIQWGILTVTSLYILQTVNLTSQLNAKRHQDIHGYQTRHSINFSLPLHHKRIFEEKPSYAGAKFYNALPTDLKTLDSKLLKKKLKLWLAERPFYTLAEFFSWRDQDPNLHM